MTNQSTAVQLSRDAVIERALALADAEGLDAVTIRRLGQDFGVTPMALYWHVQNKDELLAAMGDQLFAGFDLDLDPARPWGERLSRLMTRLVTAMRVHPGSVSLAFPRVLACPDGQAVAEVTLGLLREAGFSVRQAADIATQALRTAVTLVASLPGAGIGESPEEQDAKMAGKRAALAVLPAAQFPHLLEAAEALLDCDDQDAYYDSGVELFVAGALALASGGAAQS